MSVAKITRWESADTTKHWPSIEEFITRADASSPHIAEYVSAVKTLQNMFVIQPGFQQYFVSSPVNGVKYTATIFDTEERLNSAFASVSQTVQFQNFIEARNELLGELGVTATLVGTVNLGNKTIQQVIAEL